MKTKEKNISRRKMLGKLVGFGGLALTGSVFAQESKNVFTPWMDSGPFYPVLKPLDEDADLTIVKGKKTRAEGKIVHVTGRVINQNGEPVKGARIEIWQANKHGRYLHPSDPSTAPIDPNFQGSAVIKTDSNGRYRFKTIKPGEYPISATEVRTPHIHFEIEGKTNRLTTQMFFPDEPLNDKDTFLQNLFFDKSILIAKLLPAIKEIPSGEILLGWDIILMNG